MRTTLLVIIIIAGCSLSAQMELYTVIASSGLSLRSGPGTEYERLTVVPYNSPVQVSYGAETFEQLDTIGEQVGYWFPSEVDGQKGFLYSAYLKQGHLFLPAGENGINDNYRIVIPGLRLSGLNYDPNLHWYALVAETNTEQPNFSIQAVQPELEISPQTLAGIEDTGEFAGLVGIDVANSNEYVALLIGMPNPIDSPSDIRSKTYYNDQPDYSSWGLPVFPYQDVELFQDDRGTSYILSANVHQPQWESFKGCAIRYYQGISADHYPGRWGGAPDQDLTAELGTYDWEMDEFGGEFTFHHHPRLFWQGDLNGDSMPDLIFYQPNTSECCGGSESFYLLLSGQEGEDWSWHQVAYDVLEAWGGC